MGFKEQAGLDLARTFLNELEFAEVRQIDGEPMRVIVDDRSLVERGGAEHTDGLYSAQLLVYVSAAEYGALDLLADIRNRGENAGQPDKF